jgi:hypothetical protein
MIGSMSAISTALPRISAAIVTETEVVGEMPVPLSISTRTYATMCRATKKKIVGGRISRSSSLILADSLLMALQSWLADGRSPVPQTRSARHVAAEPSACRRSGQEV